MTIARYKKKALNELNLYYEEYDPESASFMLS